MFVGRDGNGQPKFACKRGTYDKDGVSFKRDVLGSDKSIAGAVRAVGDTRSSPCLWLGLRWTPSAPGPHIPPASDTNKMDAILQRLDAEMEFTTEDGYTGVLRLGQCRSPPGSPFWTPPRCNWR